MSTHDLRQSTAGVSDLGAVRTVTPRDLERDLRAGLRGARLVFELGIDEQRYDAVRAAVTRLAVSGHRPEELRRSYPALYVSYLVFTGVFRYESGTLWADVHPKLTAQGLDAGYEFWRSLRLLELETFDLLVESERAQTWVTRILAHGGIPISCLDPFLELLAKEIAAGAPDATELLASWRTQHTRLSVLHQPTRRFLLHGGQTAVDLLDRCMEVMRTRARGSAMPPAAEAGLPQYVLDAFAKIPTETLHRAARRPRAATSRPIVSLDPYSGLGPTVTLPPVSDELASGGWRVDDGEQVGRYAASAIAGTAVRLVPARSYEVEYWGVEGEHRRFSFEGLERVPALFLDPATEQLVRDPMVLALEEVWVLSPQGLAVRSGAADGNGRVALRHVQELPAPSGAWSGWTLEHYDLESVGALELVQEDRVVRRVPVIPPRVRPELEGLLVDGVTTADGAPVFSAVPLIRIPRLVGIDEATWQVRIKVGGEKHTFVAEPDDEGRVQLPLSSRIGTASLTVRGPLGSDLATDFAVVPGLEVRRPRHVVRPDEGAVEVSARAPAIAINDGEPGAWVSPQLEEDATIARFAARAPGAETLELQAHVARLVWTVLHDTKPAVRPSARVLRIGAEEFDDQLADLLVVRTGVPGTELTLQLRAANEELASSAIVHAAGREGRWSFDLGPFSDIIRRSDEGRLSVQLIVNGWPVHVADIVARIEVSHWRAQTRIADDFAEVVVAFDQERDVRGRVARLWPQHRPWERPIEVPVADGAREARFAGYGLVSPGPYLAEISIADPWVSPSRPRDGGPTARTVVVGSREQIDTYLEELDPDQALSHLVWALTGHVDEHPPDASALESVAGELAAAAAFTLTDTPRQVASPASFRRVARLMSTSDRLLCRALVAAAEDELVEGPDLVRLSLRLLPELEPVADEVPEADAAALWRASPIVAAALDAPWATFDESAAARCETFLGWTPDTQSLPTGGARVDQAFVAMGRDMLKEIRRSLGLLPTPLLDACELQAATFEWLLAAHAYDADDNASPRGWYFTKRRLLRESLSGSPLFREAVEEHLKHRLPPRGTEEWAAVPVVTLVAAAHIVAGTRASRDALLALDEALEWAPRLVAHDLLLVTVLLQLARARESSG